MGTPELEALARSGWSNAELIWEQIQEAALKCAASSCQEQAALWEGALDVAREHFSVGDLRLAASLANAGVGLRRSGETVAARQRLDEACEAWRVGQAWVDALALESSARSSTFHLRLESKHGDAYGRLSRERYLGLFRQGGERLEAHRRDVVVAAADVASWRAARPARYTDYRKLLAAVLLLA